MEKMQIDKQSISFKELKNPDKVFSGVGSSPIAVLNQNNIVGYFIPKSMVGQIDFGYATVTVQKTIDTSIAQNQAVLDYLKDK